MGAQEPKPPGRYVKDVKPVSFRPTRDQRDTLEQEAARDCVTISEAARRRCFPDPQPEEPASAQSPEE